MNPKSVFNATVCLLGVLILLIHIVNLLIKKDRRKDEVVRDYYKSHKYLNIINYINEIYEKNMRK